MRNGDSIQKNSKCPCPDLDNAIQDNAIKSMVPFYVILSSFKMGHYMCLV